VNELIIIFQLFSKLNHRIHLLSCFFWSKNDKSCWS